MHVTINAPPRWVKPSHDKCSRVTRGTSERSADMPFRRTELSTKQQKGCKGLPISKSQRRRWFWGGKTSCEHTGLSGVERATEGSIPIVGQCWTPRNEVEFRRNMSPVPKRRNYQNPRQRVDQCTVPLYQALPIELSYCHELWTFAPEMSRILHDLESERIFFFYT